MLYSVSNQSNEIVDYVMRLSNAGYVTEGVGMKIGCYLEIWALISVRNYVLKFKSFRFGLVACRKSFPCTGARKCEDTQAIICSGSFCSSYV